MKQVRSPIGEARFDKWEQIDYWRRQNRAKGRRRYLLYFLKYPGEVDLEEIKKWNQENPEMKLNEGKDSIRAHKAMRTVLIKEGVIDPV